MNSISFLFLVAQYGIYAFIGYWAFRKFIFPYLMRERQDSLLRDAQIEQSISLVQQKVEHFDKQVNYFVQLFEKFKGQYKKAQEKREILQHVQQNELSHRQSLYSAEQEQLEKQRVLRALYKEIAPHVYKQLQSELRSQSSINNAYLNSALKKLHDQADSRGKQ